MGSPAVYGSNVHLTITGMHTFPIMWTARSIRSRVDDHEISNSLFSGNSAVGAMEEENQRRSQYLNAVRDASRIGNISVTESTFSGNSVTGPLGDGWKQLKLTEVTVTPATLNQTIRREMIRLNQGSYLYFNYYRGHKHFPGKTIRIKRAIHFSGAEVTSKYINLR